MVQQASRNQFEVEKMPLAKCQLYNHDEKFPCALSAAEPSPTLKLTLLQTVNNHLSILSSLQPSDLAILSIISISSQKQCVIASKTESQHYPHPNMLRNKVASFSAPSHCGTAFVHTENLYEQRYEMMMADGRQTLFLESVFCKF